MYSKGNLLVLDCSVNNDLFHFIIHTTLGRAADSWDYLFTLAFFRLHKIIFTAFIHSAKN